MTESNHLIILTVPHAKCQRITQKQEHTCDYSAEPFARELQEKLNKERLKTILYVGRINRHYGKCDLNRSSCRGIGFRKNLSDLLETSKERKLFVVDCHSYPASYSQWSEYEVVLLTLPHQPLVDTPSRKIHNALLNAGVKSSFDIGSTKNDIILVSSQKGAMATLIEMNEFIEMNQPHRLSVITSVISKGIKDIITE